MITNSGKDVIRNYFGMLTGRIGGSIALGVGTAAPSATDTKLAYEVARLEVTSVMPDLANNRVVFKATASAGMIKTVYELGLYQYPSSPSRTKVLALIGNARATWTNATLVPDNARVNTQTAKITASANSTTVGSTAGLSQNFSDFLGTDGVALAVFVGSNVASIKLRMGTDANNYYEFAFNTPAAGYQILRTSLAAATVTGTPTLGNISYVGIVAAATSAGAASIFFDSVSIEDNTSPIDNILVVRNVLATPTATDPSVATDVELALGISVT